MVLRRGHIQPLDSTGMIKHSDDQHQTLTRCYLWSSEPPPRPSHYPLGSLIMFPPVCVRVLSDLWAFPACSSPHPSTWLAHVSLRTQFTCHPHPANNNKMAFLTPYCWILHLFFIRPSPQCLLPVAPSFPVPDPISS